MESELQVGRQRIRFDREATIALYRDTITVPGADKCTCISCKNFAVQRDKVYPLEFLNLLEQLGVDFLKEWEAFDYDSAPETPNHLYGGWFLFSGELIEGVDEHPKRAQTTFTYWFTSRFPAPRVPRDVKVCAVEFCAQVPWVLPEQPE